MKGVSWLRSLRLRISYLIGRLLCKLGLHNWWSFGGRVGVIWQACSRRGCTAQRDYWGLRDR